MGLNECLIIEVFAGTGRVTAALKQLGLYSSLGTDCARHKQAVAPIVLADLSTESGVKLLMQWLENPNVVGIFLAPPCGSASRGAIHSDEAQASRRSRTSQTFEVKQTPEWVAFSQLCGLCKNLQGEQVVSPHGTVDQMGN